MHSSLLTKRKGDIRGAIYSIAPSPKDVSLIWAGTDDGLILGSLAMPGTNWQNVTPAELTPWSKLAPDGSLPAPDVETAYAAVNRFRLESICILTFIAPTMVASTGT